MAKKKRKKWSQEECRVRYVQHADEIGIRTLSDLANRGHSTIGLWCKDGEWVHQRVQYQNRLRAEIQKKTIEKSSDLVSDELSQLNIEHLKVLKDIRDVSMAAFKVLAKDAMGDAQTTSKERARKFQNKNISLALQRYVNNIVNAANMERTVVGTKFADLDIAIATAIKAGLEVSNPSMDAMIAYLEGEGCEVKRPEKMIESS